MEVNIVNNKFTLRIFQRNFKFNLTTNQVNIHSKNKVHQIPNILNLDII